MTEQPKAGEQLSLFPEGKRINGKEAEQIVLGKSHPSLTLSHEEFNSYFQGRQPSEVFPELRRDFPKSELEQKLITLFFQDFFEGNVEYTSVVTKIVEKLQEKLSTLFDVYFISSVDTMYDFLYGVDGVFLFVDKNNPDQKFYITIDFTLNDSKISGNVDLVMRRAEFESPDLAVQALSSRLKIKLYQIGQEDAIRDVLNSTQNSTIQVEHRGGTLKLTREVSPKRLAEIGRKMAR